MRVRAATSRNYAVNRQRPGPHRLSWYGAKFFGQGAGEKSGRKAVTALIPPTRTPCSWPRWVIGKSLFNLFPALGTVLRERAGIAARAPSTHGRGRRNSRRPNRLKPGLRADDERIGSQSQNCQGWHMKILAESLSRPRLSVAMIVRDEQDVLAESIESVRKIADEIVVLDTGSTDRTPELAAQLGATVHRTPWENDFSAARNHCLRFVNGNWVLWLDAGERIPPQHAAELRRFLNEQANSVAGILGLGGSSSRARRQRRPSSARKSGCFPPTRTCDSQAGFARRSSASLQAAGIANRRGPLPHRSSPAATRSPAVPGQGPARFGLGQRRSGSQRKLAAAAAAGGRPGPLRSGRSRSGP